MVITLKDGSTITIFHPDEAREIVGEELFDYIKSKETYEYEEAIHEKDVEIDDLSSELCSLEMSMESACSILEDALYILKQMKESKDISQIETVIDRIESTFYYLE